MSKITHFGTQNDFQNRSQIDLGVPLEVLGSIQEPPGLTFGGPGISFGRPGVTFGGLGSLLDVPGVSFAGPGVDLDAPWAYFLMSWGLFWRSWAPIWGSESFFGCPRRSEIVDFNVNYGSAAPAEGFTILKKTKKS